MHSNQNIPCTQILLLLSLPNMVPGELVLFKPLSLPSLLSPDNIYLFIFAILLKTPFMECLVRHLGTRLPELTSYLLVTWF